MAREPRVLAIDAGGTMTDTFIVDREGAFVVGKTLLEVDAAPPGYRSATTSCPTSGASTGSGWGGTCPPS